MALEKRLLAIAPVLLTANGTSLGLVTVADTLNFKDKQAVFLQSNTVAATAYQIKRVLSNTQFIVGPLDNNLNPNNYCNISQFLTSESATVGAPEQDKSALPKETDHYFAIYESSPVNADRIIPVDPYGNLIGQDNPLPVSFDGTISVGQVEIKGSPSGDLLNVNSDGSINVNVVETPITGQTVKSIYNQVLNVVSGVSTQLISYTVPAGYTAVLERISVSGENIARYDVLYNSDAFDTRRTMFGGDLTSDFDYTTGSSNGFTLNSGDNLIIQVLHNRPYTGTFNARLQILEIS